VTRGSRDRISGNRNRGSKQKIEIIVKISGDRNGPRGP
jgi:hypothetical protein